MESIIESNVSSSVERMFGDKDAKLKVITKIDIMNDGDTDKLTEEDKHVLMEIKRMNQLEEMFIKRQLHFTLDEKGNLVEVDNIEYNK